MKIMLTKHVHAQAQALMNGLALPRFQGPGSKRPKNSLHRMGMQYDQSSAMAHRLKMASMVTSLPRPMRLIRTQHSVYVQTATTGVSVVRQILYQSLEPGIILSRE